MIKQNVVSPELPRFIFHPKRYDHAPGYPGLDVLLTDEPVIDRGCQPLSLLVDVVGDDCSIKHLHLHSKLFIERQSFRLCAGRLVLFEQDGQTLQSFTFGGELEIVSQSGALACMITSAAPIIPLRSYSRQDMPSRLAAEVQALIAQRHTAWSDCQSGYERRLTEADPHDLYCACLKQLRSQYWQTEHDPEVDHLFTGYVNQEIDSLCERAEWPSRVPSLEQML